MSRYHGITENTYKQFVVDAGEVRVGYISPDVPGELLGATRGGSTFTVETEYREMPVDGAKGPVMGGRRITRVTVKLSVNFIEWSSKLVEYMLPGCDKESVGDHNVITRELQLTDANYLSNVALIGEVSDPFSGPAVFVCKRALCTSPFEQAQTDAEEAVLKAEFEGHFTPADLDTEPYEIWLPKTLESSTTPGA